MQLALNVLQRMITHVVRLCRRYIEISLISRAEVQKPSQIEQRLAMEISLTYRRGRLCSHVYTAVWRCDDKSCMIAKANVRWVPDTVSGD